MVRKRCGKKQLGNTNVEKTTVMRLLEQKKIPYTAHTYEPDATKTGEEIRHTFCTRLCENETNLKVIQTIMGHKDIQTTMDIYAFPLSLLG